MRLLNALKTTRQEIGNKINDVFSRTPVTLEARETTILDQVRHTGLHIIPNYYSQEQCSSLRKEIDRLIEKYREQLFVDKENVDHRLFGADRLSPMIRDFFIDPFINRIIRAHEKTEDIVGLTMAARMEHRPDKIKGSGEGWHRDWAVNKQIKSIIYLSDVDDDHGPFAYVEKSHLPWKVVKDGYANNFDFNQARFTEEQIAGFLKKNPGALKVCTAKAGTLIIANTRGIHIGTPIKTGTRYAMTNYFWSNMPMPQHVTKLLIQP